MSEHAQPTMPDTGRLPRTDQSVVLSGISWRQYRDLVRSVGEAPALRMTYLDGTLEIMTTSPAHEMDKTLIARLVEAFADEGEIPLIGCGSATWKNKAKKAGLEADECYFHGDLKEVPDLAIEVVKTSGGVDKLAVYRRLGIPEIWFWVKGQFHVYCRGARGYQKAARSKLLPELDLESMAERIRATKAQDQPAAVRDFRASLRRR
jgi:Uma2 family endonuclease